MNAMLTQEELDDIMSHNIATLAIIQQLSELATSQAGKQIAIAPEILLAPAAKTVAVSTPSMPKGCMVEIILLVRNPKAYAEASQRHTPEAKADVAMMMMDIYSRSVCIYQSAGKSGDIVTISIRRNGAPEVNRTIRKDQPVGDIVRNIYSYLLEGKITQ